VGELAGFALNQVTSTTSRSLSLSRNRGYGLNTVHFKTPEWSFMANGRLIHVDPKNGIAVDFSLFATPYLAFGAVEVSGGAIGLDPLSDNLNAIRFLNEPFRHHKPIAVVQDAVDLLHPTDGTVALNDDDSSAGAGSVLGAKPLGESGRSLIAAIQ
jgi:hypothetical protein